MEWSRYKKSRKQNDIYRRVQYDTKQMDNKNLLYKNVIYSFGDTNQCKPNEPGSQIHHDYSTSETVLDMCGIKKD